jgi:hypothetical protein
MKYLKRALILVVVLVMLLIAAKECGLYLILKRKMLTECEKQAIKSAQSECETSREDTDAYSECMSERFKKHREACSERM